MDVVRRVHVTALGHEYDRIVEPIAAYRADLVYLLVDDEAYRAGYHGDLLDELDEVCRRVETVTCDLTDVYAVLGMVTTIAARHENDDVRVNVSGGGTMAAIGATIACMDVDTEATAYYVEPDDYAHDGTEGPATMGVASIEALPTYPIDSPTPDQVAIMKFLANPSTWDGFSESRTSAPKKKDCIEFARDVGLAFMADRAPPEDHPSGEDKGAFRVLDTQVLGPLEADGYVSIESKGRRYEIYLTEQGENAYKAFRHKLTDAAAEELNAPDELKIDERELGGL